MLLVPEKAERQVLSHQSCAVGGGTRPSEPWSPSGSSWEQDWVQASYPVQLPPRPQEAHAGTRSVSEKSWGQRWPKVRAVGG